MQFDVPALHSVGAGERDVFALIRPLDLIAAPLHLEDEVLLTAAAVHGGADVGHSVAFQQMMNAYLEQPLRHDYRKVVALKCRELLNRVVRPRVAVQYVVALGKRDLLWDLLIDHIEENVLKEEPHAE